MRKAIAFAAAVILCFALVSCGGGGQQPSGAQQIGPASSNGADPGNASQQTTGDTSQTTGANAPQQATAASQVAQPGTTASAEENAGSSVVAKSSNTVSDKEKQQMLDQYAAELDSVLNTINGLEDVDDSDLDIDKIQ